MKDKWEVIVTKSDSEPWWFFEGWKENIIDIYVCNDFDSAVEKYQSIFTAFSEDFDRYREKKSYMSAFWNEGEYLFCDSCDDDLQVYYGLFIMINDQTYTDSEEQKDAANQKTK